MRSPGGMRRVCWCRGGRSALSTASTTTTPRPAAGRLPAAPPSRVSADRGAGASTAAASAGSRRGTGAGCPRPSTKPPPWSSAGQSALADKAEQAGIIVVLVDERGTSSTCPKCRKRVPKPAGRIFTCPHCGFTGHRDLVAAAHIAARAGGGITSVIVPADVTHRRAGSHLPGVSPARRDPRRRPHHGRARGSPGRHRPAPPAPTQGRQGVARLTARTP
jgi:predicted RNA-binding Zn-ribbon protein involved in translation (DUF1610 family)